MLDPRIEEVRSLAQQLEVRSKEVLEYIDSSLHSAKEEKQRWEEEKRVMSAKFKIDDNILELNVGGVHYTTYKSVLSQATGTLLEAMFSGRHPLAKDAKGRYFIDCDGEAFSYILNYLRRGLMIWPDSTSMCKRVSHDLNFLAITFPYFTDSVIFQKRPELQNLLCSMLSIRETKLLYRASVDGWTAQSFHQKTNGPANTIVLVQVGNNVFGGFTAIPWNFASHGSYATSHPESFLFSLSNPSNTNVGVKLPNTGTNGKYSIYYHNDYCATFGGGHDLYIANNAHQNSSSYTNLGHGYTHPSYAYGSTEAHTFFCGTKNFTPVEVEVYSLIY
eukprot:TRINITY_DN3030_c0_g1_i2.p1 TRINITY_DN3030_c0_g1~~TRINITY_DN3030_c0_g1_i2.p1  ORF type:complete len:332 (+),score=19.94 TRINITY_DN3030_c0_g1_i2:95-1090(+)